MVLFGADRLFASHLPLCGPPHDWQVLLELEIADPALRKAVRDALADGQPLTLEPERFDLLRLGPGADAPLRTFQGQLYRGHFECGGALWQGGVEAGWTDPREVYFEIADLK